MRVVRKQQWWCEGEGRAKKSITFTNVQRRIAIFPPKITHRIVFRAKDKPMQVHLAIFQDFRLEMLGPGLKNAGFWDEPSPFIADVIFKPSIGAMLPNPTIAPADGLSGKVIGGGRPAFLREKQLGGGAIHGCQGG
jgi:hypothetical protein